MRIVPRILLAAFAAASVLALGTTVKADYVVSNASQITLEVFLGDANGPTGAALSTIGPIGLSGTASAHVGLDGNGDGILNFQGSEIFLDDTQGVINLQFLGTLDISLTGVALSALTSWNAPIPVEGNTWNIDTIGAPGAFDIALNQGVIILDNPIGPVASFLTEPVNLDLDAEPLEVGLDDLAGNGINGVASTDGTVVTLNIPAIPVQALDDPLFIYVVLSGDIVLEGFSDALVPEPSSIAMLGMGLVGLIALGRRRFRKNA